MFRINFIIVVFYTLCEHSGSHPNNLAWIGGPLHKECEHGADLLTKTDEYTKDNIVAVKAITFNDNIFVITPRLKKGVPASLWQVVRGRQGVELQPYPSLREHGVADCTSIQNAVDFYFDQLGTLWILDTGIVDAFDAPRCTCPPKVVVISLLFGKIVNLIDLSTITEPSSMLQNIVVENILGSQFIYVSDASRGAVLVHDVTAEAAWTVVTCFPAAGLQIALVKPTPTHAALVLIRLQHRGILEVDTAALRRQSSRAPLTAYAEQEQPLVLLGADTHHIYLRHAACSDVLSWDSREPFNASRLINVHSPGPDLTPTSVTADPFKQLLLILDSNYGSTIMKNLPTYHRISYIGKV